MITRIHVNQHVIRRNNKLPEGQPHEHPLTVKQGGKNTYCSEVSIFGPSKIVYSPDKPLSCGAKVWVQTESPVEISE